MRRELKLSEEIQNEVTRLIHEDSDVVSDGITIGVPKPVMLLDQDINACNWAMYHFRNARGHESLVDRVVTSVKTRWNIKPSTSLL